MSAHRPVPACGVYVQRALPVEEGGGGSGRCREGGAVVDTGSVRVCRGRTNHQLTDTLAERIR